MTRIAENGFANKKYNSKIKTITFEDGCEITSIGYGAFAGCTSLVNIELPFIGESKNTTTETYLGYIFGAVTYTQKKLPESLRNIKILDSCEKISTYAFYQCKNLEEVFIPKSVTLIEKNAFYNCTNLIINCEIENQPSTWNENWNNGIKEVNFNYNNS